VTAYVPDAISRSVTAYVPPILSGRVLDSGCPQVVFPDGYGTAGVRQDTVLLIAPDTVRSTRCRGNRY